METHVVLLCFPSKMLKTSLAFIVFSLKHVEKQLLLLLLRQLLLYCIYTISIYIWAHFEQESRACGHIPWLRWVCTELLSRVPYIIPSSPPVCPRATDCLVVVRVSADESWAGVHNSHVQQSA